mmetsp:Transcript_22220/g.53835  ORF Transcript_22220/g.53835 Transcript_22220/m.53835 type:complete len:461 (-) Transcript_22220:180-1562(-)
MMLHKSSILFFCFIVGQKVCFGFSANRRNDVFIRDSHGRNFIGRYQSRCCGDLCGTYPSKSTPRFPHFTGQQQQHNVNTKSRPVPSLSILSMSGTSDTESDEENKKKILSKLSSGFKGCGGIVSKSAKDFWTGATHVHNNYLDLWGTMLSKLKYLAPILVLFFTGTVILPDNAIICFLSENLRSALERILMLLHAPGSIWTGLCLSPYVIAKGVIKGRISSFSDVGSIVRKLANKALSPETPDLSALSLSFPYFVSVGPLIEELVFRLGIWRLWKRITTKNKDQPSNASELGETIDCSWSVGNLPRWVLLSSVLFAATHVSNHLPAPSITEVASTAEHVRKMLSDKMAQELADLSPQWRDWYFNQISHLVDYFARYLPITNAMAQCTITFILSAVVLCPVFITNGIMGSFGAHAAWNLLAFQVPFQLPLRVIMRAIRNRKRRRDAENTQEDTQQQGEQQQ